MPAVRESRQIRLLNDVVKDKESIIDLEHEINLKAVWENLRPVNDQLGDLFYETQKKLETINTLVVGATLQQEELAQFISMGKKSQKFLNAIVDNLKTKSEFPS